MNLTCKQKNLVQKFSIAFRRHGPKILHFACYHSILQAERIEKIYMPMITIDFSIDTWTFVWIANGSTKSHSTYLEHREDTNGCNLGYLNIGSLVFSRILMDDHLSCMKINLLHSVMLQEFSSAK